MSGWVAGAVVGAAVIGAGTQLAAAEDAEDAAYAQGQQLDAMTAEQRRQYEQTRADFEPWRQAGTRALGRIETGEGFREDPGYQFALEEGQRAAERSAAARGNLLSGGTLRALTRYGQGMADQQYGNWINRQQSLAGLGMNATNSGAQYGLNALSNMGQFANAAGNAYQNAANARASGYLGAANTLMGGANSYMQWNALRQQPGGYQGGAGTPGVGSGVQGGFTLGNTQYDANGNIVGLGGP